MIPAGELSPTLLLLLCGSWEGCVVTLILYIQVEMGQKKPQRILTCSLRQALLFAWPSCRGSAETGQRVQPSSIWALSVALTSAAAITIYIVKEAPARVYSTKRLGIRGGVGAGGHVFKPRKLGSLAP